jgi:DNA-binding NtrC family response regulator
MQHVHNLIGKVADTDSIVLIVGESGTGKESSSRVVYISAGQKCLLLICIGRLGVAERNRE